MISQRSCAVYNSPIAEMLIPSPGFSSRACSLLLFLCSWFVPASFGADWAPAENELARKIAAATGPGAVAVDLTNRSRLTSKESDEISRRLHAELEALGVHWVKAEQAVTTVRVSLSESLENYVWIAEIPQGVGGFSVAMVSIRRSDAASFAAETAEFAIRKTALWSQRERILDVAVLEEAASPTHLAVLDPDKVALYRLADGRWQTEHTMVVSHSHPWPRDMRGRLVLRQDHLLDAYLPGVFCQTPNSAPLTLACHESDDPWPLSTLFPLGGFFASTRNFFTGVLATGIRQQTSIGRFYSAVPLPRSNHTLWMFAMVDGQVRILDGINDQVLRLNWGSDLASLKTSCGSGWQVLAPAIGDNSADSLRAYEMVDLDPSPVSQAVEFSGGINALWIDGKGTTAVAVARDAGTGTYEAFRLAIACGQ